MRLVLLSMVLVTACSSSKSESLGATNAGDGAAKPAWAFPRTDKHQPPPRFPDDHVRTVGNISLTRAAAEALYDAPDWRPDLHPKMPAIVQLGDKATAVGACARCHLPTGTGHESSGNLAGLPVRYLVRQMTDWRHGARKGPPRMVEFAKAISDAELVEAATYYASLKSMPQLRVVESETAPRSYIGPANERLASAGGGTEPIGQRIIELPEDEEATVYKDPSSGFVVYVPRGSIARGKALATSDACVGCHGATLQGIGDIPALAGRHPSYLVRQLWDMKHGQRVGVWAATMKETVNAMTDDDMLAVAAYAASLPP